MKDETLAHLLPAVRKQAELGNDERILDFCVTAGSIIPARRRLCSNLSAYLKRHAATGCRACSCTEIQI